MYKVYLHVILVIPENMIRLGIDVETVTVVRPDSECELDVPGVREHGDDIGQGQGPLLLADGGVAGPGQVTAEAPSVNRLRLSKIRISDDKMSRRRDQQE